MTTIEKQEALVAFVKLAARAFDADNRLTTFGDLTPGSLLALRWGIRGRSIKVLTIDEWAEAPVFSDACKVTPA